MKVYEIKAERRAPLEELSMQEVTVLPAYFVEAETEGEALEELYWQVPVENNPHFEVHVSK